MLQRLLLYRELVSVNNDSISIFNNANVISNNERSFLFKRISLLKLYHELKKKTQRLLVFFFSTISFSI